MMTTPTPAAAFGASLAQLADDDLPTVAAALEAVRRQGDPTMLEGLSPPRSAEETTTMTDTNAAPLEGPDRPGTLTRGQRADLVTARQTIARAITGWDDADLPAAAAMLDRVLRDGCHHDPGGWYTAPDTAGRPLTTCYACGVSWYAAPA